MNATKQILQIESIGSNLLLNEMERLVKKCLSEELNKQRPPEPDEFITRQYVATALKITLPTVDAWSEAGILKAYKIGNKVRFLFSEVKAAALGHCKKGGSYHE